MSNYRTCKLCHRKTKSFTNYCEDCFSKMSSKTLNMRKKTITPYPNSCAKKRPYDKFDLFMICTDDYIGVTPRQMAKLYMRSETWICDMLKRLKEDGSYDRYIRLWQLKDAYDVFLEAEGMRRNNHL